MTIGERIRKERKAAGLTQKKLGELAGIAEPTIRKYELGKLNPKLETRIKIANAMNIPVEKLTESGLRRRRVDEDAPELSPEKAVLELLSCLGYDVETNAMSESEVSALLEQGYELEDDGKPDLYWIHTQWDNKSYRMEWQEILNLLNLIKNVADITARHAIADKEIIQPPAAAGFPNANR